MRLLLDIVAAAAGHTYVDAIAAQHIWIYFVGIKCHKFIAVNYNVINSGNVHKF